MSQSKNNYPNKNESNKNENDAQMIPIDGFKQIIDMLRIADPAFRESLLKRLATRDAQLANSLRRDLRHQEF